MSKIKEGFEKGLSIKQVRLYSSATFDDQQMKSIKTGFENGISVEQMKQVLGIVGKEKPSVSERLDSMKHTPCTTTGNKKRNEAIK